MSSDAPSVFWVGFAIAGAALDTGMLMSAFSKATQIAVKYPVFKGNVDKFAEELKETKLIESTEALSDEAKAQVQAAESELKEAIIQQAKVQDDLDAAFQAAQPTLTAPGASLANEEVLSKLAYTSVRSGFSHFEEFLLILKRNNIIADFEHLSEAEQTALRGAFGKGVHEAEVSFEGIMEEAAQEVGKGERTPLNPNAPK
jgi:hypothetical protein